MKHDFDEVDRSCFREQAFGNIRSFIESEMANVDGRERLRGLFVDDGKQGFNCTLVNKKRAHDAAKIMVNKGGGIAGMGDISYTFAVAPATVRLVGATAMPQQRASFFYYSKEKRKIG